MRMKCLFTVSLALSLLAAAALEAGGRRGSTASDLSWLKEVKDLPIPPETLMELKTEAINKGKPYQSKLYAMDVPLSSDPSLRQRMLRRYQKKKLVQIRICFSVDQMEGGGRRIYTKSSAGIIIIDQDNKVVDDFKESMAKLRPLCCGNGGYFGEIEPGEYKVVVYYKLDKDIYLGGVVDLSAKAYLDGPFGEKGD